VVAYLVSPYGASERAWKPFNPILGETFELDVGNGVRYFAEQVRGAAGGAGGRGLPGRRQRRQALPGRCSCQPPRGHRRTGGLAQGKAGEGAGMGAGAAGAPAAGRDAAPPPPPPAGQPPPAHRRGAR
jgi:hypothetical protein